MKLLYTPSSPLARKVRVAIHELGLQDQVDQQVVAEPLTYAELHREDGSLLDESGAICEYLNHRASGRLIPASAGERGAALRRQDLADELSLAASRLYEDEQLLPDERLESEIKQHRLTIAAVLDDLRGEASYLDPNLRDIGSISVACALDYFGFRWPGSTGWRSAYPGLAAWFAVAGALPVMQATLYREVQMA